MVSEKVLDLISKLANVTTEHGATEAEAATAMEKMQRMLFAHNLSMSDVKVGEKKQPSNITDQRTDASTRTNVKPGAGFKQRASYLPQYEREWRIKLASAVARYNFGAVLIGGQFNSIIFIGSAENIDAIKAIWEYAVEQVDRLSYEALAVRRKTPAAERSGNGKEWRNSWLIGCVQRLEQRLYETWAELQKQSAASTALVLSNDAALVEYKERISGGTIHFKSSARNSDGMAAGYVAGSRVDLNRPALKLK